MVKLLFKFWPALTPLILYGIWFFFLRKKGKKDDKLSDKEAKLWIWTLVATLVIALVCILVMAVNMEQGDRDAEYVPPRYEDGKIVPSYIVPKHEK